MNVHFNSVPPTPLKGGSKRSLPLPAFADKTNQIFEGSPCKKSKNEMIELANKFEELIPKSLFECQFEENEPELQKLDSIATKTIKPQNREGSKRAPNKSKLAFPKIKEEFIGLDEQENPIIAKTVNFKGETYTLTQCICMHNSQHQVWRATCDGEEFIVKTYQHLVTDAKMKNLATDDSLAYSQFESFLLNNKIPNFRLATKFSEPKEDGLFIMEYVVGKDNYWLDWASANTIDTTFNQLSLESQKILTTARTVLETMWDTRIDLGDFRPENVIVELGQEPILVAIDCSWEADNSEFSYNINHYIKEWSQGNSSVKDFLYANLLELKFSL